MLSWKNALAVAQQNVVAQVQSEYKWSPQKHANHGYIPILNISMKDNRWKRVLVKDWSVDSSNSSNGWSFEKRQQHPPSINRISIYNVVYKQHTEGGEWLCDQFSGMNLIEFNTYQNNMEVLNQALDRMLQGNDIGIPVDYYHNQQQQQQQPEHSQLMAAAVNASSNVALQAPIVASSTLPLLPTPLRKRPKMGSRSVTGVESTGATNGGGGGGSCSILMEGDIMQQPAAAPQPPLSKTI